MDTYDQDAMEFAAGATDALTSADAKRYSFEDYVQMDPRIGELLRVAERAGNGLDRFCRHEAGTAPGRRTADLEAG